MKKRTLILAAAFCVSLAASACAQGEKTESTAPCVVGGCSSQLCTDSSAGPSISTCEWTAAYACYPQFGECKRQKNGNCGWTQTPELIACLKNPKMPPPVGARPQKIEKIAPQGVEP